MQYWINPHSAQQAQQSYITIPFLKFVVLA